MFYDVDVKPLHDFVLVKFIQNPNSITPGGIALPESSKDTKMLAVVVAVGPGRDGVPSAEPKNHIEKGDIIVLAKYIGTPVVIDGKEHTIIKWYDVQAKITFKDKEGNVFNPLD